MKNSLLASQPLAKEAVQMIELLRGLRPSTKAERP
jgi:hypothetical protein